MLYGAAYDPEFMNPSARMSKTLLALIDDPFLTRKANNCDNSETIVNKISTLGSLKEIEKCEGKLGCETRIMTRHGKIIFSSCDQKLWTNIGQIKYYYTFLFLRIK